MPKNQGHRLRVGRYSSENQIYLITTVTHTRKPIFQDFTAGRIIVKTMKSLHDTNQVDSLAFVIMPDHIHWLFQLKGDLLSNVMKAFKGVSARKINQHFNTRGKIWQAAYHDRALRKEDDLQNMARYIVANPLRAGLVKTIRDYPLWDAV